MLVFDSYRLHEHLVFLQDDGIFLELFFSALGFHHLKRGHLPYPTFLPRSSNLPFDTPILGKDFHLLYLTFFLDLVISLLWSLYYLPRPYIKRINDKSVLAHRKYLIDLKDSNQMNEIQHTERLIQAFLVKSPLFLGDVHFHKILALRTNARSLQSSQYLEHSFLLNHNPQ